MHPHSPGVPPERRSVLVRASLVVDFDEASALVQGLVEPLVRDHCTASQRTLWLDSLTPGVLAAQQRAGVRFATALCDGRVAGIAALRDVHHLVHLYVAAPLQRRGVGRALWDHLRGVAEADGARDFYVNAWLEAVPVYRRFGFEPVGSAARHLGVPRQPMIRHRFP